MGGGTWVRGPFSFKFSWPRTQVQKRGEAVAKGTDRDHRHETSAAPNAFLQLNPMANASSVLLLLVPLSEQDRPLIGFQRRALEPKCQTLVIKI